MPLPKAFSLIQADLQQMKKTDFTFKFKENEKEESIKVHKLVLSSVSDVFDAMFYGPMKEKKDEVVVEDISYQIFRKLIE